MICICAHGRLIRLDQLDAMIKGRRLYYGVVRLPAVLPPLLTVYGTGAIPSEVPLVQTGQPWFMSN